MIFLKKSGKRRNAEKFFYLMKPKKSGESKNILSLPLPPDFFYDFLLFRKLADKLRKIKILFDEIS